MGRNTAEQQLLAVEKSNEGTWNREMVLEGQLRRLETDLSDRDEVMRGLAQLSGREREDMLGSELSQAGAEARRLACNLESSLGELALCREELTKERQVRQEASARALLAEDAGRQYREEALEVDGEVERLRGVVEGCVAREEELSNDLTDRDDTLARQEKRILEQQAQIDRLEARMGKPRGILDLGSPPDPTKASSYLHQSQDSLDGVIDYTIQLLGARSLHANLRQAGRWIEAKTMQEQATKLADYLSEEDASALDNARLCHSVRNATAMVDGLVSHGLDGEAESLSALHRWALDPSHDLMDIEVIRSNCSTYVHIW